MKKMPMPNDSTSHKVQVIPETILEEDSPTSPEKKPSVGQ